MSSVPTAAAASPVRPPLKWAGGKRWQLPFIEPLWRPHSTTRLVEPFCGGLAITLGLRPRLALLNDVNPHVINLYRQIQAGLEINARLKNEEAFFYRQRARFNLLLRNGRGETAEAATAFYYLNRTGYNGLCRFNASGEFNVPFGRYAKINYQRSFTELQAAFADWQFVSMDFEAILLEPGDFVYADPPYDVPFTQYSKVGFTWEDQERTAKWLAAHEGPVVLANQATPRIMRLYRSLGYCLRRLDAPRRISCTGDRSPAREVLATRNLP